MGLDSGTGATSDAGTDACAGASCSAPTFRGDTLDILFMIDNSNSMADAQKKLASQFPRLVAALTAGRIDGQPGQEFPPVQDLHLGVVSSDMGLVGVPNIPGCGGAS